MPDSLHLRIEPSKADPYVPHHPLHYLTAVYLSLPGVFFAMGWLRAPVAQLTAALLCGVMFFAICDLLRGLHHISRPGSFAQVARFIPAMLLLTGWLLLSGIGGNGFQNVDYSSANALFHDLIKEPWPLRMLFEGQQTLIVYYTGYFLPAAWAGKSLGWAAANLAMAAWAWAGVMLSFGWFWRISHIRRQSWYVLAGAAAFFCLASGLDAIGFYAQRLHPFDPTAHIEWWAYYFQYSSQTTLLFWAPQQALAGWLAAGIIADCILTGCNLKYMVISVATAILWSPLAFLGLAPFLLILSIIRFSHLPPSRISWREQVYAPDSLLLFTAAAWCGLIYGIYIASNDFAFPHGFIWQDQPPPDLNWQNLAWSTSPLRLVRPEWQLWASLGCFYLLEFGLLAIAALLLSALGQAAPRQSQDEILKRQRGLFLASILVLLAIPLYRVGFMNDFPMRASIPALFIFWSGIARLLFDPTWPADGRKRRIYAVVYGVVVVLVVIGAGTSAGEIYRSKEKYHRGAPAEASVATTSIALGKELVQQRAGNPDSFFAKYLLKP